MIKGRSTHRWSYNKLEERFARAWSRQAESTLQYVLSEDPNRRTSVGKDTHTDVATVVQWLGSPVGQGFLEEVLGEEIGQKIRELSSKLNEE